jgi:hypothetical protein
MDGSETQGRRVSGQRRRLVALAVLVLALQAGGPPPEAAEVSSGPPAPARGASSGFNAPNGCRNITLVDYPAAGFPRVLPLTRLCPFEPRTDCRSGLVPQRSRLLMREKRGDSRRDRFKWKLKRGQALTKADLGNPTVDTDYELCVYIEVEDVCWLVLHPDALAGAGWKERSRGFKFRMKRGKHPEGLRRVRLRTGPDRKSRIAVKGKGHDLDLRALPVPEGASILVQLYNSAGQCWSNEFGEAPLATTPRRFKDRSD